MPYTATSMKFSLALLFVMVWAQTVAQAESIASQYLMMSRQLIEQYGITVREDEEGDRRLLFFGQETCRLKAKGASDRAIISAVAQGTQRLQLDPNFGIALGKATLQAARETGYCETVQEDFIKVETVSAFLATSRRLMVERGLSPAEAEAVNETKLLRLGKKVCELRLQGRSVETMKKVMIAAATKASKSSPKQVAAYIIPTADAAQQELCPMP
ncbi:MAG: hypothetical protein WCA07_04405 [Gloeobacterales cyanobacterium]